MKNNDRWNALQILTDVIDNKHQLGFCLQKQDYSPLTKALCFGVCRHYFRLQKIAQKLLLKQPEDKVVWLCLLLGLFQLHYLAKPAYATVQETVGLLNKARKSSARALVNAVLRRFCREKEEILGALAASPEYQNGHPAWLQERIRKDWPEQWLKIIRANDEHPPLTLRVNQRLIRRGEYLQLLQDKQIPAKALPHTPQAIAVPEDRDVTELPGYMEGYFSVQDEAAQAVISLLDLKPGQRVLDACAAPGGKTCAILEAEPLLSHCLALDISKERTQRIEINLKRLGLNAEIAVGDASEPGQWWNGVLFDRILLDAPCSALGVIRRHPDIKLLRTPEEVLQISQLQSRLLSALWPLLKPSGLLVYATCSILPIENDLQIRDFSGKNEDCEVLPIKADWGQVSPFGWQILPGEGNCDGFFYSVLRKAK